MLLNLLSLHQIWGRPPASSLACPRSRGYVPSESHRTQCLHHRLGNWGTTLYSLTPTLGSGRQRWPYPRPCEVLGSSDAGPAPPGFGLTLASSSCSQAWAFTAHPRLPGRPPRPHVSRSPPGKPCAPSPWETRLQLECHFLETPSCLDPLIWAPRARADLGPPGRGCWPHIQGTALSLHDCTCLGGAFTSAEHTASEHQPVHIRG